MAQEQQGPGFLARGWVGSTSQLKLNTFKKTVVTQLFLGFKENSITAIKTVVQQRCAHILGIESNSK